MEPSARIVPARESRTIPPHLASLTRAFHEPAIFVRSPDRVVLDVNAAFERLFDVSRDDILGRPPRSIHVSDESHQEFGARLGQAMRENATFSVEWPLRRADGTSFVAKLSVAPVHDSDGGVFGFIGSIVDLTHTRHAAARARLLAEASRILTQQSLEPEALLRSVARLAVIEIADYCAVSRWDGEALKRIEVAHADPSQEDHLRELQARFPPSPALAAAAKSLPQGKTLTLNHITFEQIRALTQNEALALEVKKLGLSHVLTVPLRTAAGLIGTLSLSRSRAQPFTAQDEELALELADRAASAYENAHLHARLAHNAHVVKTLQRVQTDLAESLDLERIVQTATDAGTTLTNAAFGAFFYNVNDGQGGRYTLYTLSGVPREAFSQFQMPRKTAVFAPTFDGTGVMRSDDITKDARYGHSAPHHGMPKGHLPVRSYLAVPVVSQDGTVHGGLFFGHPEPGRFTEDGEELARGIAAYAAIALDNAHLYRAAKLAEERLRSVFESAPVQILTTDAQGRIETVNRSVSGRPLQSVVGTSVYDTLPAADRARIEPLVRAALTIGTPTDYEVRVDLPAGPAWRQVHIAPVRDGDKIAGSVILSFDINARKAAEAALLESEERFRTLVTATTNMVWSTDAQGNIVDMPEWRAFTGQTREEVAGAGWLEAIHPDDRDRVAQVWIKAFAVRAHYEAEYRVRGHDGEFRTFLARGVPRFAPNGELTEYIGTWTDITPQKSALEEAESLRAQLIQGEKLAALGSLVSGVAHELRTPLTYLANNLFLIESTIRRAAGQMSPEQGKTVASKLEEQMRDAHESIERINKIVEDLRRYTKLKATRQVQLMSLDTAARDAVELYCATHRGQAVVESDLAPTSNVPLDRIGMQQVVLNLLQNAGEAHPRDGRIRVRTYEAGDGSPTLEVRDEGQGVPQAVLERIWDPFFTTKPEGTGLGLSIVKRIVEAHNARITCETSIGEGTTFRITFQRA